jgi:hypothetical protein
MWGGHIMFNRKNHLPQIIQQILILFVSLAPFSLLQLAGQFFDFIADLWIFLDEFTVTLFGCGLYLFGLGRFVLMGNVSL